jgi:hypothetical protein
MRISHDVSAHVFGNDVDAAFEDMATDGTHSALPVALIATALDAMASRGADEANIVGSILAHVAALVEEFQTRDAPVEYVA